jgi:pimeloyl-ACP methyl ester carboxylesterase
MTVCTRMTLSTSPTTRSLTVPGARLHYEVRGAGPLLLVVGSPMAAAEFAPLADALAGDHTVVTYDPRGHANSTIEDPDEDATAEQRADDIAAILDDLGAEAADVFGSSGGAVTGLALVLRHPGRVHTLVAHEPPLLELLPDAEQQRANTEDIIDTFHADGMEAAWFKFMVNAGFDTSMMAKMPEPPEPTGQDRREAERFFDHEMRPTTRYLPDVEALKASTSRVVIGIGADSGQLLTYKTSVALCELLGVTPVEFPGDHGGFMGAPEEFAEILRRVLADQT